MSEAAFQDTVPVLEDLLLRDTQLSDEQLGHLLHERHPDVHDTLVVQKAGEVGWLARLGLARSAGRHLRRRSDRSILQEDDKAEVM